ncbi:MAG: methyltransferase, partial [Candidatus Poribacteria bacterium]
MPSQSERQRKRGKQKERQRRKLSLPGMLRLMVVADESGRFDVEPPLQMPYLLELVGDTVGSNAGRPFLAPISVVQEIQEALRNAYSVPLLGETIVTSRNVFPPNSPETIALFFEGLEHIKNEAPSTLDALDMGCGSGCLTLLAAQVFEDHNITIVATDHLPEALATTKINIQRFLRADKIPPDMIEVTQGGDLFEPIPDRRFDVIIFNAPWVVAPAR